MFPCVNVDPDGVYDGDSLFLRNDYSISCSSPRYRLGYRWAIAMVILYPFGVVSFYACKY